MFENKYTDLKNKENEGVKVTVFTDERRKVVCTKFGEF